jgi:hypothetical protein
VALFGRKSYEIYLFHTVLLAFMWMASAQMKFNLAVYSVFWLLLFLGLSLAMAYLISRWWSEPMNNAIRRGLARRSVPQGAHWIFHDGRGLCVCFGVSSRHAFSPTHGKVWICGGSLGCDSSCWAHLLRTYTDSLFCLCYR